MHIAIRSLALAIAAIAFGGTAQAEDVYLCEVKSYSSIGWIGPKILIAISDDHETGWVYDGMIKGHIGGKLPVAVRQRKEGVFNISWKLKGVSYSDGPGSDTPSYRVMLNTRAGIMTETVVLLGMDGQPLRGQGKCKPYTGKS